MKHENGQNLIDVAMTLALAGVLFFVVNPVHIWMPSQMQMLLSGVFVAVFAVVIAVFWREKPHDEREEAHAAFAGRVAFFAGTTTMAIGIVYQSMQHAIEPWLALSLIVMLASKVLARIYARTRR